MSDTQSTTLSFEIDRSGDVAVVRCHGKLVAGVTDMFYNQIHQLIPGTTRIVLDLSDLIRVSAKSAGCRVELVNLGKQIKELLGLTHLWSVFAYIGETGAKLG